MKVLIVDDGLPVRAQRTVSWELSQPTSTHIWEVVQSYVTGVNQRLASRPASCEKTQTACR